MFPEVLLDAMIIKSYQSRGGINHSVIKQLSRMCQFLTITISHKQNAVIKGVRHCQQVHNNAFACACVACTGSQCTASRYEKETIELVCIGKQFIALRCSN